MGRYSEELIETISSNVIQSKVNIFQTCKLFSSLFAKNISGVWNLLQCGTPPELSIRRAPWTSPNALLPTLGELEAGQLPDPMYTLAIYRQYAESLVAAFAKALTSAVRLSEQLKQMRDTHLLLSAKM